MACLDISRALKHMIRPPPDHPVCFGFLYYIEAISYAKSGSGNDVELNFKTGVQSVQPLL